MKLNNIFPDYNTFKNDVIDKLDLLFPNVEWLNEQNSYMSFQTLYGLLTLYYGDRDIRYDNSQTFINKFTFDLADVLPDIYAKQQVFINNELKTYLSSAQNRAIKIQGGTTSKRQQNNNSKSANSTTPTNIVITNANELDALPITSANLNDITLIDNINSSNEQTNFKYIDDLVKNLNTDYSLRLKEFMNILKKHFTFIDTSNVENVSDGLYNSNRFRNGYYVSDVNYLGVENQDQIKLLNGKVQTNTTNIEILQSNIGSLPNFNNLNDAIKKNANDIKVINNDQVIQNNNIDANKLQIQNNTNNITSLIEQFKRAGLFAYMGVYIPGTTYKLGQVVSDNGELYLCLVDETTEPTSNSVVWQLLNFQVDMTQYFTKDQINQIIQDLQAQINELKNNVQTNTTNINTLQTNFSNYYNKSQIDDKQYVLIEKIALNTTNIDQINSKFANYYSSAEIDNQQNSQNQSITNNTNSISELTNYVKYNMTTQPRNVGITNFTFTGKTLNGAQIYEGVLEFEGAGESNLVNNCTILLGAYLYDISQNKFISPESVNLRVHNSYQIRASLPNTTRCYRLYFVGVRNG